jgi:hypothetical protein
MWTLLAILQTLQAILRRWAMVLKITPVAKYVPYHSPAIRLKASCADRSYVKEIYCLAKSHMPVTYGFKVDPRSGQPTSQRLTRCVRCGRDF